MKRRRSNRRLRQKFHAHAPRFRFPRQFTHGGDHRVCALLVSTSPRRLKPARAWRENSSVKSSSDSSVRPDVTEHLQEIAREPVSAAQANDDANAVGNSAQFKPDITCDDRGGARLQALHDL